MLSERLAFILSLDADGAVKGFQRVGQEADKSLGKVDARLDKLSGQMTKFGAVSMAASGVAAVGLFNLGSAAAELNAAGSASVQVLGESAAAVDKWADSSVRAVGLSKRAALESATQFGGIAKAAKMSTEGVSEFAIEQTQLAADLAAFKNINPAKAIMDLQSGYAGSTEVLRQYNIYVDDATLKAAYFRETGEKVTGTLTSQQRIIAMHSEIMRQSADMQGQWNREVGEAPAKQAMLNAEIENFKAGVGEGVLPAMTAALGGLNSVVGGFNKLDDSAKAGIGTFAAFATAGLGAAGAMSFVGGQALKLVDQLAPVGEGGERAMTKLGKAAATASIGLGVAGLVGSLKAAHDATDGLYLSTARWSELVDNDLASGFQKLIGFSSDEAMKQFKIIADENVETARRLVEGLDAAGVSTDGYRAVLEDEVKAQRQGNVDRDKATKTIAATGDAADSAAVSQADLAVATELAAKAAKSQASALRAALDATYGAGNRARDADDAIASFADSMSSAGSASSSAARSIDLVAEKQKAVDKATEDADRALQSQQASLEKIADATDRVTAAREALDKALRGPSDRDRAEALNSEREKQIALAASTKDLEAKRISLANAEKYGNERRIAEARVELERATLAQERATWAAEDATTAYNETMSWSAETDANVKKSRDALTGAEKDLDKATRDAAASTSALQSAQAAQVEAQNASLASFASASGGVSAHKDRVHEATSAYYGLRDSIFSTVEAILSAQTVQATTLAELSALEAKVKSIAGLTGEQRGALLGSIYSGRASAIGFAPGVGPYGFASGTPSMPTGTAVVGENGPELMRRTATGVEVVDGGRSRSVLQQGGGGVRDVNVTLVGTSMSPHEAAREVAWLVRTA